MGIIEKWYTFIIFIAVVLGMMLCQFDLIQSNAELFILPFLMFMLYVTFLRIPFKDVKAAFSNKKFTLTSVAINFIWTPIFAWLLASIFLSDYPALFIGFIMLMVTPCTDWYLIFTSIAKGNVALSTAILPLNLLLQVTFLPFYLMIFANSTGVIEISFLIEGIILVLFIPFVLTVITKLLFKNKQRGFERLLNRLTTLPILFLSLAIVAMFASNGQLLVERIELMLFILIPIVLFFSTNFFISQKVGQYLSFSYADNVSLSVTTLARNSPIALAIAMTAFPNETLIAIILVIGPLLELPILAMVSQALLYKNRNR